MLNTTAKYAKNLQRFRQAVGVHDRENDCTAFGIGLSFFDMDRLGFDEAEELWPSITVHAVEMTTGNFRVLCDGEHGLTEAEERAADAMLTEAIGSWA